MFKDTDNEESQRLTSKEPPKISSEVESYTGGRDAQDEEDDESVEVERLQQDTASRYESESDTTFVRREGGDMDSSFQSELMRVESQTSYQQSQSNQSVIRRMTDNSQVSDTSFLRLGNDLS